MTTVLTEGCRMRLQQAKALVGGLFVKPEDDPEWVRQKVKRS